ncbi:MAG TPA: MupG family TIM beta-alpha barrel fold protein [Erysipelothrix sp.]|nr:MupG family TIM beta-alpha barrel fold protein [Erysipelothrix sp.]
MRRLGISIYPDKSSVEDMKNYIDKAHKYGFSRIFSCLLSVDKPKENIKQEFIEINEYAKDKGFEVIVDVSPRIFDELGISYQDLSFFDDIKADGIRLDVGYTGNEESLMTFNPYDLKIEINMSNDTHYIDTIMDYKPNRFNLIGCHNFYPHNYSGLNLETFTNTSNNFKKHGLKTAAFISSQVDGAFGPWVATEGLPTLEMHRELPIDIQLKHMIALDLVDDVIISNCYPSDEELESIAQVNLDMLNLRVELVDNIPEIERSIVLDERHFNRGDTNDNMIRSTQSRVKHKGHNFEVFNTPEVLNKGDIIIESSLYGHYAGELQIVKQTMINSGKSNVVGKVIDEEHFLIDTLKPWSKFRLTL